MAKTWRVSAMKPKEIDLSSSSHLSPTVSLLREKAAAVALVKADPAYDSGVLLDGSWQEAPGMGKFLA
jgi:hypothetical protein